MWWLFIISIGLNWWGETSESDFDDYNITRCEEIEIATDIKNNDIDSDRVKDGDEALVYKTNPLLIDSDNDKLEDSTEMFVHKTNPLNSDTDSDGLSDDDEIYVHKLIRFK